jgi:hypothetical protein
MVSSVDVVVEDRRSGPAATLTAEIGMAVFGIAFAAWVDPTNQSSLDELIGETLRQLPVPTAATSRSR